MRNATTEFVPVYRSILETRTNPVDRSVCLALNAPEIKPAFEINASTLVRERAVKMLDATLSTTFQPVRVQTVSPAIRSLPAELWRNLKYHHIPTLAILLLAVQTVNVKT